MNLLPRYYLLLRKAFDASELQDLFDSYSEDRRSEAKWREVCGTNAAAQVALADYVVQHGSALRDQLEASR